MQCVHAPGSSNSSMLVAMHYFASCTAVSHRLASCKPLLAKCRLCSLDACRVTARGLKSPLLQPSEPACQIVGRRCSTCFVLLLQRVVMPEIFGLSSGPALNNTLILLCFRFSVISPVRLFWLLRDLPLSCLCPVAAHITTLGFSSLFQNGTT